MQLEQKRKKFKNHIDKNAEREYYDYNVGSAENRAKKPKKF